MPKIFEYLGIIIRLFSADHAPIHFHANYQAYEIIIRFYLKEGKIIRIEYEPRGKDFPKTKLTQLKKFVNANKFQMLAYWEKFYIFNSKIKCQKISPKDIK